MSLNFGDLIYIYLILYQSAITEIKNRELAVQYKVKNSSNSRRVTSQIRAPQPKLPKSKAPDDVDVIVISDDDAVHKPPKLDPIVIVDDDVLQKRPKVDPVIIVLTDEEYEQTLPRKKPRLKRRRRYVFTSSSESDTNEEGQQNTSKNTAQTDQPGTRDLSNTTGFVLSRDSSDSENNEEPTKEDIAFIDDHVARDESEFCHAAVKFDTSDDESPLQIEEPEEKNA